LVSSCRRVVQLVPARRTARRSATVPPMRICTSIDALPQVVSPPPRVQDHVIHVSLAIARHGGTSSDMREHEAQ
jgi:hypothetical protein